MASAIASRFGDAGLPNGRSLALTGSAGLSFGAFSMPGMRLVLVGDANDGVGRGMRGGEVVICPPARERGRARQVLAGNAALYGATGGRLFIAAAWATASRSGTAARPAVVEGARNRWVPSTWPAGPL